MPLDDPESQHTNCQESSYGLQGDIKNMHSESIPGSG
jgi:hypothetical protein